MNKETLTEIITKGIVARNAIRKLVKNGQGPKTKIPALLEFQKVEPLLDKDGYYGPNSEAALKFYLSKLTDNEVPKSHEAYSKVPATWKPPSDLVKTAVEAKPAAPKPKAKKVVKKKSTPKAKPKPKKKMINLKGLDVKGLAALAKSPEIKAIVEAKNKEKKKKEVIKNIIEETPKFGQENNNGDLDAEEMLSSAISDPLDEVRRLLLEEEAQNQATYEHNKIVKENKTNEELLSIVKDIQKRVKNVQDNPLVNTKDYRILGLFV